MTWWEIISTLVIGPLKLLFEVIFVISNRIVHNSGLSIIVLSLVMNILVLPLYRRADAIQEEERLIEQKLDRGVKHIKKTFKGDERMMMLQTYYRQNNYKPTHVLKGAISLLLEIPFFMAAYSFLSNLELLSGVSFGPIADLGAQDGLVHLFGMSFNILPVIMTAVNLISCAIFTKEGTVKQKIQLYGMAVFFLFFLYSSPSGLVFYWTLNNVFSLVKTIFYKIKNPGKVIRYIVSVCGIAIGVLAFLLIGEQVVRRTVVLFVIAIALQIPLLSMLLKGKLFKKSFAFSENYNSKLFFFGTTFMALLTGAVIPSQVMKSSPQEFVDTFNYTNPLFYILSAFCLSAGTFVIWCGVFYKLATPKYKAIFDKAIWLVCGIAIANYMIFKKDFGNLLPSLKYEKEVFYDGKEQLINIAVIIAVSVLLYVVFRLAHKYISGAIAVASIAMCIMAVINTVGINASVQSLMERTDDSNVTALHSLSKSGKNVIVMMLDRAVGEYIPFIMNEDDELKEQYAGFTYYSNVVSFANHTNYASPPLYGGYEYTPIEMNKRDDEALKEKHNEALKVMPVLFDENGYDVTVCDASYANYEEIPDLSIYDEYPDIKKFNTKGRYVLKENAEDAVKQKKRNFFCYSLLKIAPCVAQGTLYNLGNYNSGENGGYSGQTVYSLYNSEGIDSVFMDNYSVLDNLNNIVTVDERENGTFLMITNEATHAAQYLQEPEYIPQVIVDNTEWEDLHCDRYCFDNITIKMENETQYKHYQTNVGVLKVLGKWFDELRELEVWDNTKIILVSDHSYELYQIDELIQDDFDAGAYFPLLMVKDFDAEEFSVNDEFMTNGDVPTLALNGVVDNPINPFTGKIINSSEKHAHEQYIVIDGQWMISENNGKTFLPSTWYSVSDNIWEKDNWNCIERNAVLKEYK